MTLDNIFIKVKKYASTAPPHIKFLRYRIFSSCVMHKKNYVHLILQIWSKANDVIKIA